MHTLKTRKDAREAKIAPLQTAEALPPVAASATTDIAGIVEIMYRALIAMEKEMDEVRSRSRNVIVTGISSPSTVPDDELFESFCEDHLTVKPQVVRLEELAKINRNCASPLNQPMQSQT
jgi:hypothetical protein